LGFIGITPLISGLPKVAGLLRQQKTRHFWQSGWMSLLGVLSFTIEVYFYPGLASGTIHKMGYFDVSCGFASATHVAWQKQKTLILHCPR